MENIINKILIDVKNSEKFKSSHWKNFTKNFNFENNKISGIHGFGGNRKRNFFTQFYHNHFQNLYFRNFDNFNIFGFYEKANEIVSQQNRVLDLDVLRHVLTLNLLNRKLLSKKKIKICCVIGDGQANFSGLALKIKKFEKLISINLPEVLINDLNLLKQTFNNNEKIIFYARNTNELDEALEDKKIKLILLSANSMNLLYKKGIDLFVNIASMQEMTRKIVDSYFDIIKSNKSYFYCCNREEKILPDGEKLNFSDFNWGISRVLLDELCPWHQYFYKMSINFKFKKTYHGPHRHRLVKF